MIFFCVFSGFFGLICLCSFFDFVRVCVVVLHLLEIILHPTVLGFHFFRVCFSSVCGCFYFSEVFLYLFLSLCSHYSSLLWPLCSSVWLFIFYFLFFCLLVFFVWLFDFFWWSAENNTSDTEVLVLGLLLVGSSSNSSMILKSYHPPSLPPLWPHLCW